MAIFRNLFKKNAQEVSNELLPLFNELKLQQSETLNILRAEINELRSGILSLESKLFKKDLVDKQQFGQIHYKLHELPHKKDN